MTRAAALSVLGLLRTVPAGFNSSPFSSEHGDRWSYICKVTRFGTSTPASCSPGAGPTWDRRPHVETAFPSLELVFVVEQHKVGPGNGAVLGRDASGLGPVTKPPSPQVPKPPLLIRTTLKAQWEKEGLPGRLKGGPTALS